MADISSITLPDGSTYTIKDETARLGAVTGSTIQATETTKDDLPEAIKAVLDSVNPQNWAAGIYRGKFIRNGGGVKISFTGDYHMMVSSSGGNYTSQGIVAAQGSIFNIWYKDAVWVVTKQAPADLGITGTSVGDLVRISAVSGGKPTAFEKASLNAIKCNRNLLDNWYFVGGGTGAYGVFPVNQRGQQTYSGAVFGIDRWKGINQNVNVIVSNNYLRLYGTNGNNVWLRTQSENKTIYGKQITISMLLNNGTLLTASGILPVSDVASHTGFSTPAVDNINFGVYKSSDGSWFAQIGNVQSGSSVVNADIIAVKVELGSTQTLAHQESGTWVLNEVPDYETELLHCKTTSTAYPSDPYSNGSVEFGNNIGIVQNTNTATQNITAGQYVIWKGTLYKASSAIASGATLSGSNLTAVTGGGLNAIKDLFSAVTIHTSNAVAGTDVVLTSGFNVRSIGNLVLVHINIKTTNTIPAYQTLISGLPDHAPIYGFALAGSNGVAYRCEAIGSLIACPETIPSGIYLNGFLAYTHTFV